ncbi:MAG TPA: 1-deoxy-D-xylulose-5-phosphate reductoisomerase, partial [Thermomicrobiales bacterium]|nr:1-deoxy-D-xylulose-5-phosphate reductoisomerase [Thermomicrobiales bacterium]
SAIWQSLGAANRSDVARLILTASGGPFRQTSPAELARVTVAEALSHPTWSMGGKITIDSATLMNKGLEVIEARWLFDIDYDKIDVLIHPESIIHSLVEFQDGSQIAQLSLPDMRLPIQYALTYPRHESGPCRRLSLAQIGALHFEEPDLDRFPALKLARDAGQARGTYPTVLSAADDAAVDAFVQGKIRFPAIIDIVARTLDRHAPEGPLSWDSITAADRWARETAGRLMRTRDHAFG